MRISILVVAAFLSACNSNDVIDPLGVLDSDHEIKSFTVTPSAIDPAINDGTFTLAWDIENPTDDHYISLYISENSNLTISDTEIFDEECTDSTCGTANYAVDCTFNNNNVIACPGLGQENISSFITSVPMDAYFILESCDTPIGPCDTKAAGIQLR